jgi:hypothetical protein
MNRTEAIIVEILDPVNFDQPAKITGFEGMADRDAGIKELLRNGAGHGRGARS